MEVLAKLELIFHHIKEYGNRGSTNCWKVEGREERGERGEREGERGEGREGRGGRGGREGKL